LRKFVVQFFSFLREIFDGIGIKKQNPFIKLVKLAAYLFVADLRNTLKKYLQTGGQYHGQMVQI